MSTKTQNAKIIFGLKVKQLRVAQGLSFKDFSEKAGVSISYLNEIEKGKKYPKGQKIKALANTLGVSEEDLTSGELHNELAPVGDLLGSNFLNEIPLELFGIDISKVVDIIANAPTKVGAFITTLVELSRNYALREENFYFGALRSYLELNSNYFEDLEQEVADFTKKYKLLQYDRVAINKLSEILEEEYNYKIVEKGLDDYPDLQDLRSVYVPKTSQLLLNSELTEVQKVFQLGKELGFNYLDLKERANTSSLLKVNSFEEVLSHFKAGYFSAALLINREKFIKDTEKFFANETWNGEAFLSLLLKYRISPETLFQRFTNVIPQFLGIKSLFLLRFVHSPAKGSFLLDKEMHINGRHNPQGNGLSEHYCRRWLSLSLLEDLYKLQTEGKYTGTIVGAQKSRYYGTEDEYFCITLARPAYPSPEKNVSVTIGLLIDDTLREKMKFLNDPSISFREVNNTCERCAMADCSERSAPPIVITTKEKKKKVDIALKELLG